MMKLLKKFLIKQKIIRVIKDKYTNWEEKGIVLFKVLEEKENWPELLVDIAENNPDPQIRKGVSSVLAYMKLSTLGPWMVKRILLESDWTVRFALARSANSVMGIEAINLLNINYHELIKQTSDFNKQQKLKISFVEGLGAMSKKEGIPLILDLLTNELNYASKTSFELINHIIYNLGEIGDEFVLEYLHRNSLKLNSLNVTIRNSLAHAQDKIAKKMGLTSFNDYLKRENN